MTSRRLPGGVHVHDADAVRVDHVSDGVGVGAPPARDEFRAMASKGCANLPLNDGGVGSVQVSGGDEGVSVHVSNGHRRPTGRQDAGTETRIVTGCERLHRRELEVLHGMAGGLSDAEIGDALHLGRNTVKTYAKRLFRHLGVRNRAHAVHRGYQLGLLTVEEKA